MNAVEFVLARQEKFSQYLRERGLELPSSSVLRSVARPLGARTLAYDAEPQGKPITDTKKMTATFVISTPRKDRYGDVVIPRGVLPHLDNYRKNPRVFLNHRTDEFPIGSARRPDGTLDLVVEDHCIRSTCWFHGQTRESEVAFALVDRGELEACSIGFIPVVAALIREGDDEDRDDVNGLGEDLIYFGDEKAKLFPGLRFHEIDLTEWSVCGVGANQEAIACHLSRGHVGGLTLTPSIRRSLEPFAAPMKVWSPGAVFEQLSKESPPLSVSDPNIPEIDAPVVPETKDVTPMPGEEIRRDEPAPEPEPEDPTKNWSHGARLLKRSIDSCLRMCEDFRKELDVLDQPKVRRFVDKKIGRLTSLAYKAAKLAHSVYPDKFDDPGEPPAGMKSVETPEPLLSPVVKEVVATEPEETAVTPPELDWGPVQSALAVLLDNQQKISEKLYELTGIDLDS